MKILQSLIFIISLSLLSNSFAKTTIDITDRTLKILVNQLGYLPDIKKVALLTSEKQRHKGNWKLLNAKAEEVAKGELAKGRMDPHTGFYTHAIDFSSVTALGTYTIEFQGEQSLAFDIAEQPYAELIKGLLRSYYLQRCGHDIDDPISGMQRKACHLKDGVLAHNDDVHKKTHAFSATGGWHDAGDYGKYVGPTSVVLLELLSRYERHEKILSELILDIPESSNALPDLLDEMKIGLDWMLTMQREDGAVYRKLSGDHWPPVVAPEEDNQTRFLYGISSPETGKAAASWALAARIYKKHDSELAKRYLKAAQLSWKWLGTQNDMIFDFHEGDDKGSGPYSLNEIDQDRALKMHTDDKFAAAMELYLTTGDKALEPYLTATINELDLTLMEWKNASPQSMLNALWHPQAENLTTVRENIRKKLTERTELAYQRNQKSAYGIANHRWIWGSNKMAAEEGILLKQASLLFKNEDYNHAAWEQLHYLLGRNAFNQTFVSGYGKNPVKHVNHIYGKAAKFYIPGLHVGGPNERAQAGIAPKYKGPLSYADSDKSYATNEYAIDYNSALISLLFDLLLEQSKD